MGTTRIKVIDLSSDEKEIKTARKHTEKMAGPKSAEKETKPAEVNEQQGKLTEESAADTITGEETAATEPEAKPKEEEKTTTPKTKKAGSKKQTHHLGKKYNQAKNLLEEKAYSAKEAFELMPKISFTKFDPTVEIHFNVSEKNLKGSVALPHPFETKSKAQKILVFTTQKTEDKNIIPANEKTVDEIENGTLKPNRDFDVVYAEAKFMPALAKVAKILGPKGLMPNPKNGTVISSPAEISKKSEENLYSYKTDPNAPIIHAKLGKLSAQTENLNANLRALAHSIGQNKIKKATLTSTMSPAIKVDPQSI